MCRLVTGVLSLVLFPNTDVIQCLIVVNLQIRDANVIRDGNC